MIELNHAADRRTGRDEVLPLRSALLLALLAFALHFAFMLASEKIQTNGGLGMDGVYYTDLSRKFGLLFSWGIGDFAVQRIFPSAIAYYIMTGLHLQMTNQEVVRVYCLIDSLGVAVGLGLDFLALHSLGLRREWRLAGLLALAGSFATLKWISYYPILTDSVAFALASGMFLAYLRRRQMWMVGLTSLASFTWPSCMLMGLAMLALPRHPDAAPPPPTPPQRLLAAGLALLATAGLIALSLTLFRETGWTYRTPDGSRLLETYQPDPATLPLSYALMAAYAAAAGYALLAALRPWDPRALLAGISWPWAAAAAGLYLAYPQLRQLFFHTSPIDPGYLHNLLRVFTTLGVASPGRFLLPHIVYYGPFLLFTAAYWRSVCDLAARLGLGLLAALALGFLQGLESESRHLVHVFPVMVGLTLAVLQDREAGRPAGRLFFGAFALMTLGFSRVWLRIGGAPFLVDGGADIHDPANRLYFLNHGPYVIPEDYARQSLAILAAALLLFAAWPPLRARIAARRRAAAL